MPARPARPQQPVPARRRAGTAARAALRTLPAALAALCTLPAALAALCTLPAALAADREPEAVPAPSHLHRYRVVVDEQLTQLRVRACLAPGRSVERLVAGSRRAMDYLQAADPSGRVAPAPDGRSLHVRPPGADAPDDCLRYTVDLGAAVAADSRRVASRYGDDVVVRSTIWLWRPPALAADEDIEVRFALPPGMNVSVPWAAASAPGAGGTPESSHEAVYRVGRTPPEWPARTAFGRFRKQTLAVPGAHLRLATLGDAPAPRMASWLTEAAGAVSRLYGEFPLSAPQVLVMPAESAGEPVPWAQVVRGGGAATLFFVDGDRPLPEFRDDWTATHEFSHLLLPYVQRDDAWLSEGLASYYQNVLRARAGMLDERSGWERMEAGFARGRAQARFGTLASISAQMHTQRAYRRVYWSGAAYWLEADLRLRRRTGRAASLDTVLAALRDCCLPATEAWTGERLLTTLDALAGTTLFAPLADRYLASREFPDVAALYADLGVIVEAGRVRLDEAAPDAPLRRAIMGRAPPPQAAAPARVAAQENRSRPHAATPAQARARDPAPHAATPAHAPAWDPGPRPHIATPADAPARDAGAGSVAPAIAAALAASPFDPDRYAAHVATLASDAFAGRAPGTPGGRRTVDYLTEQFAALGLDPAGEDGYRQPVPLVEIAPAADARLAINGGSGEQPVTTLAQGPEVMLWTRRPAETVTLADSELVFVGYGIVAPEYEWDDYAAVDVTGKTVVVLVNDPGFTAGDESLFRGKAMTRYGRWTYKLEEAARQGAAAALIVHETEAAAYPWQVVRSSWSGPQRHLAATQATGPPAPRLRLEGWITRRAANQLFTLAGFTYAQAERMASRSYFQAIPLQAHVSATLENRIRRSVSHNVLGRVPGTSRPSEHVVYTAHWDHLGTDPDREGDRIYNGAVDNASGVAGLLELARVFATQPTPPERSVLFLAVTAEESGLLGSAYYAAHPTMPLADAVAAINIDGMNIDGPTRDVVVVGWGQSELDEYLRDAATEQGRKVIPEATPERGYYFRSDHFNFARKGVPALYAESGLDYVGRPPAWGVERSRAWNTQRYHQPGDEYDPDTWNLDGALLDLQLYLAVGRRLANETGRPRWYPASEFGPAREAGASPGRTDRPAK